MRDLLPWVSVSPAAEAGGEPASRHIPSPQEDHSSWLRSEQKSQVAGVAPHPERGTCLWGPRGAHAILRKEWLALRPLRQTRDLQRL